MTLEQKFSEIYNLLKNEKYAITTNHVMDNWAADRWETPTGFFATMCDAGYSRSVGWKSSKGVVWAVHDFYPAPLRFENITEEEFLNLTFNQA